MCFEKFDTMRGLRRAQKELPPGGNVVVQPGPEQVDNMRGVKPPDPALAPPPVTVVAKPPEVTPIPQTAQQYNEVRAQNAAPQTLGGLAARFSIPVGKQGYSKSLRPEAGRLVR